MPAATMEAHKHHWMIDPPVDGTAQGYCIFCNVPKTFSHALAFKMNWHETTDTFRASLKSHGRAW